MMNSLKKVTLLKLITLVILLKSLTTTQTLKKLKIRFPIRVNVLLLMKLINYETIF